MLTMGERGGGGSSSFKVFPFSPSSCLIFPQLYTALWNSSPLLCLLDFSSVLYQNNSCSCSMSSSRIIIAFPANSYYKLCFNINSFSPANSFLSSLEVLYKSCFHCQSFDKVCTSLFPALNVPSPYLCSILVYFWLSLLVFSYIFLGTSLTTAVFNPLLC